MFLRRIQRYHALSVFGDMKPHDYANAVMIGSLHISNPTNRMEIWPGQKIDHNKYASDIFEGMIKQLMADGLLQFVDNANTQALRRKTCGHDVHPAPTGFCFVYLISPREYDIQLTEKGRDCLAMEQITRSGDYSFYKNFDGTIDSAKKINPGLF